MTVGEALEALRACWGEIHLDVGRSGAAAVSNVSSAKRAWSGSQSAAPKVYEAQTLAMALTSALHGEGLGVGNPAHPEGN